MRFLQIYCCCFFTFRCFGDDSFFLAACLNQNVQHPKATSAQSHRVLAGGPVPNPPVVGTAEMFFETPRFSSGKHLENRKPIVSPIISPVSWNVQVQSLPPSRTGNLRSNELWAVSLFTLPVLPVPIHAIPAVVVYVFVSGVSKAHVKSNLDISCCNRMQSCNHDSKKLAEVKLSFLQRADTRKAGTLDTWSQHPGTWVPRGSLQH